MPPWRALALARENKNPWWSRQRAAKQQSRGDAEGGTQCFVSYLGFKVRRDQFGEARGYQCSCRGEKRPPWRLERAGAVNAVIGSSLSCS